MVFYYLASIAGSLSLFFWQWYLPSVSESNLFLYWVLGAVLVTIVVTILIMIKRLVMWSLWDLVIFVWLAALGVTSFCGGMLHLEVVR